MNVRHVNRPICSINLGNQTTLGLIPQIIGDDSDVMVISRSEGGPTIYASTMAPISNDRVLVGVSISGSKTNGFRWVPYIDSDDITSTVIRPFVEVYSPSISYDSGTNLLTMWFWTNFNKDYTGTEYDEAELFVLDVENYNGSVGDAHRALCIATGSVDKFYISGGLCDAVGTEDDPTYDWIPVFTKPKIASDLTVDSSRGVMVDFDSKRSMYSWKFLQENQIQPDGNYWDDEVYTDTDMIANACWSFVDVEKTIVRLDIQGDATCGGRNTRIPTAMASCFIRHSAPLTLTINWEGEGGNVEDDNEQMMVLLAKLDENEFVLEEEKLAEAHSPGGNPYVMTYPPLEPPFDFSTLCVYGVGPIVSDPSPPIQVELDAQTIYRLQFWVTTKSNKYHYGAYYQFAITMEES